MSAFYDNLTADIRGDITIGGTAYICSGWTDNGHSPVETTFQNSDGSWRGDHVVKGQRTASFSIEIRNATEGAAPPDLGDACAYDGNNWYVKSISKTKGGGGTASSWSGVMGWVSAVS